MRSKIVVALVAVAVAASASAGGRNLVRSHVPRGSVDLVADTQALQGKLIELYGSAAASENVYVGSEFCAACHSTGLANAWRNSKHNQALRRAMTQYSLVPGKGVVADYDSNATDDFIQGLDFNQISSVFDKYKPNAPKLSVESGQYYITIGELKMPVIMTQGGTGNGKQRYLVKVPLANGKLSAENYVSPIQFNDVTKDYVLYNAGNWYDSSNMPKFGGSTTATLLAANNGSTYSQKCIGCHTTGVRDLKKNADGEWVYTAFVDILGPARDPNNPSLVDYDGDGNFDLVNIGCEACHGPGGQHVLSRGDPAKIVNPAKLSTDEANEVCGQCHIRVKSVPGSVHDWPYNDATGESWYPGSGPLAAFYKDAGGYWPDGETSRQHHQQYQDFYRSSKPTFQFHPTRCTECHRPHSARMQSTIVSDGVSIPTAVNNNTLCLACHATHGPFETITKDEVKNYADNVQKIGAVVSAHSYHPYGPDRSMGLSRCTTCHMPATAVTAIAYDIHSHTFDVVPPEKTMIYQAQGGMPNACAVSCHATKVNSFGLGLDPSISTWNAQFDKDLATALMTYYGPEGLWWQRSVASTAFVNPHYRPPSDDDN